MSLRRARPGIFNQDGSASEPLMIRPGAEVDDHYGSVVGAGLLRKAELFADAAEMALEEDHETGAMMAALAGVTAVDALCLIRLGRRSSPPAHRDAVRLLIRAESSASAEASTLETLLRIREGKAQWSSLTPGEARKAVVGARSLVSWAEQALFAGE